MSVWFSFIDQFDNVTLLNLVEDILCSEGYDKKIRPDADIGESWCICLELTNSHRSREMWNQAKPHKKKRQLLLALRFIPLEYTVQARLSKGLLSSLLLIAHEIHKALATGERAFSLRILKHRYQRKRRNLEIETEDLTDALMAQSTRCTELVYFHALENPEQGELNSVVYMQTQSVPLSLPALHLLLFSEADKMHFEPIGRKRYNS